MTIDEIKKSIKELEKDIADAQSGIPNRFGPAGVGSLHDGELVSLKAQLAKLEQAAKKAAPAPVAPPVAKVEPKADAKAVETKDPHKE